MFSENFVLIMAARSLLFDILDDEFLTLVATNIGNEWDSLFINLGFKRNRLDHFAYKKNSLLETVLDGLHNWKKKPLTDEHSKSTCIKEILDLVIEGLQTNKCKGIADEIQSTVSSSDINQIIDLLSDQLTMDERRLVFSSLKITHESIQRAYTSSQSLKAETKAILDNWYKDLHFKYWKCQELFTVFRNRGELSSIKNITEKYMISDESNDNRAESTENRAKASNQGGNSVLSVTEQKINSKKRLIDETSDVKDSGGEMKKPKHGDDTDESKDNRFQLSVKVHSLLTSTSEQKVNSKRCADEIVDVEDSASNNKKPKHEEDTVKGEPTQNSYSGLRKYQEELAENALQGKNTIICAVTNAGKTIVAFHIIDEHMRRNPNAKVVFMARTNPLLDQQYKKACDILKYLQESNDIKQFLVGQESTDESARLQFDKGRLFFMTPQLLMNKMKLEEKFPVPIDTFSMLVLDECHHVHGKTPYNDIMATYRKAKHDAKEMKLPQIVGLTASPGTNKAKDEFSAKEHLMKVMTQMDVVHLSTVRKHKDNLQEYTSEPEQVVLPMKIRTRDPIRRRLELSISYVEELFQSEKVQQFLDIKMQDIHDVKQSLQNPPIQKLEQTYVQWITETRLKVENVLKKDEYVPRLLLTYLRHLEIYAECLEMNSLLDTHAVVDLITRKSSQESIQSKNANTIEEQEISKYLDDVCANMSSLNPEEVEENPDVQKIIHLLQTEYEKQGDNSRFLIFVKTRATAMLLAKRLENMKNLNCQYFTGSQVGLEDGGLTKHKQLEVLNNFKSGVHKCIVATSVASEGIDIPECNMTIRYRFTANEITSCQMRGRIRTAGGKEFIIGSEKENLRETINIERMVLMKKAVNAVIAMTEHEVREKINRGEQLLFQSEDVERKKALETRKHKVVAQFKVNCRKCSKEIVDGHNLRILKSSLHVVFDNSIYGRITRKPITHVVTEDIKLTDKVSGECGHEWGHINLYNDCELVVLAQKHIKVYNVAKQGFINIKKWKDVPYKIETVDDDDILAFRASQLPTPE
ncbi:ATP-dependent RNA helicase DHX58-like [Mytilus californianus]|uniref:ATP-dependent RNA helicase DHX58-like n=1 Tax=Mytilus californianus TaxID=6549 RepID=UPI002247CB00|nr:ATP-dependent RNA helicase DHX58-like [Mytilus californianus]